MTADERIERLLSRFGQTISDLPKPEKKKYSYGWYTSQHLDKAAREWGKKDAYFDWAVVSDYACHLCDVIDRLEIALETALRLMPCEKCTESTNCYRYHCDCDCRIKDEYLSDVKEEDLNEEVYGWRK